MTWPQRLSCQPDDRVVELVPGSDTSVTTEVVEADIAGSVMTVPR